MNSVFITEVCFSERSKILEGLGFALGRKSLAEEGKV